MSLGMGMGFGGGPSAHSDVLSASPDDVPSKLKLVEEIKNRGRACVGGRNYPDAASLYNKGIEVLLSIISDDESAKKEAAILYSNLSLVLLQMGKVSEALDSAEQACENDPTYVKAHWRKGQACNACGNTSEALASFERALSLEPANKALKREVDAAKEKKEQEEKLLLAAATEANADAGVAEPPKEVTPAKKDAAKTNTTKPTSSGKSTKNSDVKEDGDTDLFTKSDHVRGYKIRSDGKKTSYFDREISEESKQLIGDIAPKRIDPNAPTEDDNSPKHLPVTKGTSAWNNAGTWEERDVTSWAKETLEAALLTSEYVLPEGSPSPGAHAVVSKVSKLEGHASYAAVRGKKRYIYEFGFTVDWVLTLGDDHKQTCHGKVTFPDVDGTVELGEGYDIVDYHVDGSSPAGTGPLLERFVRDGGLRESIHNAIDDWVRLFRATY